MVDPHDLLSGAMMLFPGRELMASSLGTELSEGPGFSQLANSPQPILAVRAAIPSLYCDEVLFPVQLMHHNSNPESGALWRSSGMGCTRLPLQI